MVLLILRVPADACRRALLRLYMKSTSKPRAARPPRTPPTMAPVKLASLLVSAFAVVDNESTESTVIVMPGTVERKAVAPAEVPTVACRLERTVLAAASEERISTVMTTLADVIATVTLSAATPSFSANIVSSAFTTVGV